MKNQVKIKVDADVKIGENKPIKPTKPSSGLLTEKIIVVVKRRRKKR